MPAKRKDTGLGEGKRKRKKEDLENEKQKPFMCPEKVKNKNVVNFLNQYQSGNVCLSIRDQIKRWAVIKQVSEFSDITDLFDQRITALCWHHSLAHQNLLAVAIKNGYIVIGKVCPITEDFNHVTNFAMVGKGCAVYALKFDPVIDENIFTTSWDGPVCVKNTETGLSTQLLNPTLHNQWFTSLDVSPQDGHFLVSGCTTGRIHMIDRDGKPLMCDRLHQQRILSVQLCPRDNNLLATASLDKTVKLWDLRNIRGSKSYLAVLPHNSPPGIATFSLTGCNQLLTSDQSNEVRVYSSGNWKLLTVIEHPHRQYMHITPIRASWHPTAELIVIGRYPASSSSGLERTIDFLCPTTGKYLYELFKLRSSTKIASINLFNSTGNILASGRGDTLVLWSKFGR